MQLTVCLSAKGAANATRGAASLKRLFLLGKLGGRSRTRTCDPLIKSQLLYQLSYAPAPWQGARYSKSPALLSIAKLSRIYPVGPRAYSRPRVAVNPRRW